MDEYPKGRPKFFATEVMRKLVKMCAANEIGPTATLLILFTVAAEDAWDYRRAVTWYDVQLMPILGVASQKALQNARLKAVKSGWLVYHPLREGTAGRYWVEVPAHAK